MNVQFSQLLLFGSLLFVGCSDSGSVAQPDEDPVGFFSDETSDRLPAVSSVAVRAASGDVDNDGDADLIVAPGTHTGGIPIPPQDFLLHINSANGYFSNEAESRLPASAFGTREASTVLLGDIDGDADLDVFVAKGVSGFVGGDIQDLLWINNGSGTFTDETATRLPSAAYNSFHALLGDVDNDGDLDIAIGVIGPLGSRGQNRLLINDGAGVFADETATRVPFGSDITLALALGDLDGDADLDIVVANGGGNESKLLINNGTGFFTDETSQRSDALPRYAADVSMEDLNGDGSVDLIFADIADGPYLYVNSGAGVFINETDERFPVYDKLHGIASNDVDKDGDSDVLFTGPPQIILLLNDGSGSFSDVSNTHVPTTPPMAIRYPLFVDVDNDGDPDLYLADSIEGGANQDLLWINSGPR